MWNKRFKKTGRSENPPETKKLDGERLRLQDPKETYGKRSGVLLSTNRPEVKNGRTPIDGLTVQVVERTRGLCTS